MQGADSVTRENNRHVQARELKTCRTLLQNALERYTAGKISQGTYVRMVGRALNRLGELAEAIEPKGGA